MSKPRRRSPLSTSPSAKHNAKAISSPATPPQTPAPRPAPDDRDAWKIYWVAQGQQWRTEPEISPARQKELDMRRSIAPDSKKGIYPFKEVKLNRADIEWLLATHENGRGPVDWSDENQQEREGLDLRGADLRLLNLSRLPLAKMKGGARFWNYATVEDHAAALSHLEGASLFSAHLEGSFLAHAHLENADLSSAHLEAATLNRAHLQGAWLAKAHLEGVSLKEAHLEGASLDTAHLEGANLCKVSFDHTTILDAMILGNGISASALLLDVHWNDANLSGVNWSQMGMLGDEYKARQKKHGSRTTDLEEQVREFDDAVRAYRQIAVALQAQGLNEDAARFAYRAQILQKSVLWLRMLRPHVNLRQRMQALGAWLFSWFLYLIAGYGYKPNRSFLAYLLVISGFATAYYLLGHMVGPALSPLGAFVFSMTSFHGRGFFPGNNIALDDPLTVLAALEALVGLIIEVTFIATLTQRFFNR